MIDMQTDLFAVKIQYRTIAYFYRIAGMRMTLRKRAIQKADMPLAR